MAENKENTIDDSKLFKVRKTIYQMMEDRGYLVDPNQRDMKFEDFQADSKKQNLSLVFSKKKKNPEDQEYKISVKFFPEDTVDAKTVKDFCNLIDDKKFNGGIMIGRTPLKSMAKRKFEEFAQILGVEYFVDKELIVNITQHELVPKHILLDEQQKKDLLNKYKLKESQLPKILTSDPVARYLGVRRGNVVKIIRISETAGRYITYRIAV